MHVLFAHQNFPAQFRYLAPRLARDHGWRCSFVTHNAKAPDLPGVERVLYRPRAGPVPSSHFCTHTFQGEVGHAHGAYEALKARKDLRPDLVVAHSGFGSGLFLPLLYDAPVVNFLEYLYRPVGRSLGYRPEVGVSEGDLLRSRCNNAMLLLDLDNCDRGWTPANYQRDLFPGEYRGKIEVIPEGVDTDLYPCRRTPDGQRRLPDGTSIPAGTRVVTYVSRGFEMMRGFDLFMRAAKRIYEQFPDVVFVMAGTDKPHYGGDRKLTGGASLRRRVLEWGDFDLSRFHFTGWLSEPDLAHVLSLGDLHVYLTAPFITSWSMLDAMSTGCVVLASEQSCTREYLTHERSGLLCDFFDVEGIARQAVEVLKDPLAYRSLGEAARRTIEDGYSLQVCLPRLKAFFEDVASRPRSPSVRAERLVRPPALPDWSRTGGGAESAPPSAAPMDLRPFDGNLPYFPDKAARVTAPVKAAGGDGNGNGNGNGHPSRAGGTTGKTVMFCWELGAGLGHLMQMLPLAHDLARRGHRVVMALRQLDRAVEVYGRAGVSYLQAPVVPARRPRFARAAGFAHLLANTSLGEDRELFAHACAWRNLVRAFAPDLVVFDHAPTALLASRGFPLRRAVIGSGFCVPPDTGRDGQGDEQGPWAVLRPAAAKADPQALAAVERDVLGRINWVLANWKLPPMDRLGQLYSDADETFLTTFPELDHFPPGDRCGAGYWGPVLAETCAEAGDAGAAPQWPDGGSGRRVFAYLKATPAAEQVLWALKSAGCPALAYVDGIGPDLRRRLESAPASGGPSSLRVAGERLDLRRVSRQCDLAVLHGGHGVTLQMLLAGRPLLLVPLVLEQQMTASAVERLGAGLYAPSNQPQSVAPKLTALLGPAYDRCAAAAERFARRYAAFEPARQRLAMVERAAELLSGGLRPAATSGRSPLRPTAAVC